MSSRGALAGACAAVVAAFVAAFWLLDRPDTPQTQAAADGVLTRAADGGTPEATLPEAIDASAADGTPAPELATAAVEASSKLPPERASMLWERLRRVADGCLRSGVTGDEVLAIASDLLTLLPAPEERAGLRPGAWRILLQEPGQGAVVASGADELVADLLTRTGTYTGLPEDGARNLHMVFSFDLSGEGVLERVRLVVQVEYQRTPEFAAQLGDARSPIVEARVELQRDQATWTPVTLAATVDQDGRIDWRAAPASSRTIDGRLGEDQARAIVERLAAPPPPEPPR